MTAGVPARGGSQARRRVLIRRASAGASWTRMAAVAVMLACAGALYGLTNASVLDVRRTVVEGIAFTGRGAVVAALYGESPGEGAAPNVVRFDTAAAAARIAALPAVAGASVRAVLPDRLVGTVRERAPLLVWVTAAERFAVDAEGRLFAAVQEDPPGVDGPLPTVSDERRSAAGLRVGEQLAHTDLLVARQLVAVTPALLGSRARTLEIHVTDNQGYVLDARPTGWSAVFGIYTASTRPPDLVPRQVQCLRSLLADTGEALQRVILAPEGGSCGTYLEP